MSDKTTISRIAKLHPKLRGEMAEIISLIQAKNIDIRVVQGYRTFAEQQALYDQGRVDKTKPIVTNAKPGDSFHNYGLAIDFCLLHKDGTISWNLTEDMDKDGIKDWMEVVEIFESKGWFWGGNFKSIKDNPHFEKSFGKTLTQLKQLPKDKDGYVILD